MKCLQSSRTLARPSFFIAVLVVWALVFIVLHYIFLQKDFLNRILRESNKNFNLNVKVSSDISTDHNSDKYIIYFCDGSFLCGGWADRIKGIFAGYLIANATGRKFKIQMDVPCEITNYLLPNSVNWTVDTKALFGKSSKHFVEISNAEFQQSSAVTDLNTVFVEDVIYFSFNLDLVPYIRRNPHHKETLEWMELYTDAKLYFHLFRELFQLKPKLSQKLLDFRLKIADNSRLFCAQIRMGKNPSAINDSEVRTSNEDVLLVWDFFRHVAKSDFYPNSNHPDPKKELKHFHQYRHNNLQQDNMHYLLFVTSDSEQVRIQAANLFPQHFLDLPGNLIHIERSLGSKEKLCEGFGKVILDQLILGYCDILVISKSGFGEIAAYMRLKNDNLYCLRYSRLYRCYLQNFDFDLVFTLKITFCVVFSLTVVLAVLIRNCLCNKNKK